MVHQRHQLHPLLKVYHLTHLLTVVLNHPHLALVMMEIMSTTLSNGKRLSRKIAKNRDEQDNETVLLSYEILHKIAQLDSMRLVVEWPIVCVNYKCLRRVILKATWDTIGRWCMVNKQMMWFFLHDQRQNSMLHDILVHSFPPEKPLKNSPLKSNHGRILDRLHREYEDRSVENYSYRKRNIIKGEKKILNSFFRDLWGLPQSNNYNNT